MNTTHSSKKIPGCKRAIIGMAALLLIFLTLSNVILLQFQRKEYIKNFRDYTLYELDEAATFMVEPLLRYQFDDVNQFIQKWADSHQDVIKFEATTPKGHTLSSFQRESTSPFQISIEKKVSYANQHLLTLSMTKDYSKVESILSKTRNILIFTSLFVVSVLGFGLWIIFRRLAIQPLEDEIAKRYQTEKELENTNRYLDERVKQRTQELYQKNQDLTKEIQQREITENLLASEKELLAVTLRSIGDGVITTDIAGSIVFMNKITEALTGWSQEEAIGRPLQEVFHIIYEQNREVCESPVEKVMQSGQIVGLTNHTLLIGKDGRELIIADSAAPVRDKDSIIVGVVLVFRDMTDQLRTEKELLKIRKLESVGVLAGGIAHDFNNILAAILGNINLALFDADLKDKTKNLLAEAEKASLRAKDLTQQLLTFAKGGEPVMEASSLEIIIKDSANFVLRGDKVACRFDVPENLWLVEIDKGQISQVIQNIVLNARHAMPEGGIIKVSCENISTVEEQHFPLFKKGRFVKICIEDSGIGIPAKVIEKIFDPYFSTKHGGSGLGLAISQSIISKHGGHITVESSPGVGTTFTLYLPASMQTKAQDQKSEVYGKASSQAKILIMDDEEMVRTIAKEMLVELGHEVVLSRNGEEAIQLYQEAAKTNKNFDLILMDLTIPGGMGGKKAVQEILAIDSNAKVIVSSGYSNDPIMANFKDYGFCSSIVKPYQLQELSKVINQLMLGHTQIT